MANNTTLDPGTGGDTIRDVDRSGVKTQVVGLDLGIGTGSESLMSGSMPINDNAGSLTVDNAGTFATQVTSLPAATNAGATAKTSDYDTGAGTDTVTMMGIALPASGGAAQGGTSSNPVRTDPTGTTTQPVSGTITANAGTGVFHVDDNAGSLTVDNAGTFAVQDSEKIADNAGFTDGTSKVMMAGFAFDETAGTALTENDAAAARVDAKRAQVLVIEDATTRGQRAAVTASGAVKTDGSGVTQPISVAAVVHVDDNSGSLTVDAPVGTPVFVTATPSATGGWSKVKYAAQTTTVQTTKGSAGAFGGYYVYNPNSSVAYVQVFDTSGAVTLGTTAPDMIFAIPAASAANLELTNGVNMANAIKLACTTTATGSTAPATGLDLTVFYK